MIKLDLSGLDSFNIEFSREAAHTALDAASRLPLFGWSRLPEQMTDRALTEIADVGRRIAQTSDALVVVGAGGSSLGARALTDAVLGDGVREIYFAGDNLSGEYLRRLLHTLESREYSVIVSSKSGATAEPAAALRVFLRLLREKYGEQASERLYVVAGEGKSPLRSFAEECGCALFAIPSGVGGRYSVLTAAGLFPAAARGLDIHALVEGARREMETGLASSLDYAAARQALYTAGYKTEIFASFEPSVRSFGDWWRQLFGESEGKDGRGIFPATVRYTGDLHSMGQYVQDGPRDLFETLVTFGDMRGDVEIPANDEFDDGFDFLAGRGMNSVNGLTAEAVKDAHVAGGVPVVGLHAPGLDEESLGAMVYFFQRACAASAMLSGVNPFDQPGVEEYKRRMITALRGEA